MSINTNVEISEENVPKICAEIRNIQISHRLMVEINENIGRLLENIISLPPNDSSDPLTFASVSYIPFTESTSQWRLLFIQILITLPCESVLAILRNRLLCPKLIAGGDFNLRILLCLISTIVVCCKKGTFLLTNFLHEILLAIFSSIPSKSSSLNIAESSDQTQDLAALLDDSLINNSQISQLCVPDANDDDPAMALKFAQLLHVLSIVRQIGVEDCRLTAFSYGQWWRQNFSASPIAQEDGDKAEVRASDGCEEGVLATRRSLELLATLLSRLLPFERSPVHLSSQISVPAPFWVAVKDLASKDNECSSAWNAYLDVARGRLAELRMERGSEKMEPSPNSMEGWSFEVQNLVESFMKMNGGSMFEAGVKAAPKLPSSLIEMNLFRGAYLRETILPMLRKPPPSNISEEMRAACALLLQSVESRLLLRSTEATGSNRSPVKKNTKGGKRSRLKK